MKKQGLKRWFKRRILKDLREICREKYGDKFVEEYDKLCNGIPIGGYDYTLDFCHKVELARKEKGYKA